MRIHGYLLKQPPRSSLESMSYVLDSYHIPGRVNGKVQENAAVVHQSLLPSAPLPFNSRFLPLFLY